MKPLPASTLKVMTQEGLRATEIVRLWPHQVIDLKTRLPEELCTPRFTVRREAKSEHVANTLKIYGVTAAQRLHDRLQLPLLVPLTGGRDSRTVLSLAVHAGLPVSAFTFLKRWMAMAPHDRKIPPVVAQTLGVSHSLVAAKSPHSDSSHLTAVEQHLGIKLEDSNSDGSIGFYLSRDLWKWTGDKSLLLTGLYFDLMQGRYASFERPQSWFTAGGWQVDDTTTELVRALLQRAIGTPGDTADFIRRTGAEYWAYNQFYLQVVMTAYDMSGHVVVPLANCARFNEIALGCENNELCGSQPQRELLSQIAPRVASLPFRGTLAEPRNYLDYLRRGCPGLRNRLVSALRRFA
jgi:hypothetical protein